MQFTKTIKGQEAKEKLMAGVDMLVDAVKVTMGAKGRNVIITNKHIDPHVTKDGVTVARSVKPIDPVEKAGADIIRQAANKTVKEVGDGTTSSSLLAQSIVKRGLNAIKNGSNPIEIKTGIEMGVAAVVPFIKKFSKEISNRESLKAIATISANGDEFIGDLISGVVDKIGKEGEIKVVNGSTADTYADVIEGMVVERGYASPYFSNNKKMESEYENPLIFAVDFDVKQISDLLPLMESAIPTQRPIVLFIRDIQGEALSTLVMNKVQSSAPFLVVKSPGFGQSVTEYLMDISVMTGAALISDDFGLNIKNAKAEHAGTCSKIISDNYKTVIMSGNGNPDAIENRIKQIKMSIEDAPNESLKLQLQRRLVSLNNGIGIVYVGGLTDVEVGEKKDRIDDAVCATKASLEEGVVAGGGITYIAILEHIEKPVFSSQSQQIGFEIVMDAITDPFKQICENAGLNSNDMIEAISLTEYPTGINVKSGELCDMIESGIIDPAKVTRVALENAASVACSILTCEVVVYENEGGQA
jgi:chaperonin GroEL